MPDERSRLASLTVVGGALDGLHHDITDVVGEVLIGSDPGCQLCVDLPSISPIHARIWTELGQATARDTSAPRGLYVNTVRVETEVVFGEGDVLWLGPPSEPESVCIRCRFEPWQEVLPFAAEAPTAPASAHPEAEDPFFIALDAPPANRQPSPPGGPSSFQGGAAVPPAPGSAPKPPEPVAPDPVMSAAPVDEAGVVLGVPDEAWTIGEASPVPASPVVLPALSPQPDAGPAPSDEFLIAEVVEPVRGEEPLPAIVPLPAAPPAPAAVARAAPPAAKVPPAVAATPTKPLQPAPRQAVRPAATGGAPAAPRRPAVPGPHAPAAAPPRARAAPPVAAAGPPKAASARPAAPPRPIRPTGRPAASPRPASVERRPPSRSSRKRAGGGRIWLRASALVVGVVAVLAAVASWRILGAVAVDGLEPARVRVGQRAAIQGRGFSAEPEANVVLFDDKRARVLGATAVRLEIEVPEVVSEAGSERNVSLLVQRGSRSSRPITVSVLQGPRLHALSPQAAMPGEEVALAGAGLGLGASVRFGDAPAQIAQAEATRIRVVVPDLAVGASAPVVVGVGGADSNAVPFVVGRLPVVTGITPASAAPGDVIRIAGLGFLQDPLRNDVQIGGSAALVVSASNSTLEVVVPQVVPGEAARAVAVRVSGNANVGTGTLDVPPPADAVELRFVAEPLAAVPGRPHAVVATGLGPAFVLAASGGRTAAQRALDAQGRLNQAVAALRTTLGLSLEARGFGASPVIGLSGRPDVLLEVTAEDAAAYGEDWTRLRGRGGAVTRDRLARWWEAVARDLVLLLVRGEKPRYAAQLAVEGRVLAQVFEAARKTGQPGVPRGVLEQGRPPLRDGLRLVALRVPAAVMAPLPAVAGAAVPVRTATPVPARIPPLEGMLRGSETEAGERRYLTVTFQKTDGTIAFEGGITVTMPLVSLQRSGVDRVSFAVNVRGGWRYYVGRWDGQNLVGAISLDEAGQEPVGTFELHR